MRRLLLLLALALPLSAVAEPVDDALTGLGKAYGDVKAVRADFSQVTSGMSYMEPMRQTGTIAVEAPGKMRWDFQTPRKTVYLTDGDTLWVVDEGDKTTQVFQSVDGLVAQIYGFLTGTADLRSDFRVSIATDAPKGLEDSIQLKLVPKESSSAYESLRLYLDKTSHRVVGLSTLSAFGDRTDMTLSKVEVLDDLPDADFVYSKREGFREIQAD